MVSLSLCRKTFKLKGNKKFRTWTKKSSTVFRVSGFLCYQYMCVMDILCMFHISVSWVFYNFSIVNVGHNTEKSSGDLRWHAVTQTAEKYQDLMLVGRVLQSKKTDCAQENGKCTLSSVSSTEKDTNTQLTKAWTAIDRLSIIWKSDLTDKMKRSFLQAAVVSRLLYGCTTWTLTKRLEKKLNGNYTRMLRAILNKSWRQHPQGTNYTATCLPSRKLSKLDEPNMQDTAGEARTSS